MDINGRINYFKDKKGWSINRLAKEADLSQSTVSNLFNRDYIPTIHTLEKICGAFGITLSYFFAEGEMVSVTEQQKELLEIWLSLNPEQQENMLKLIKSM